MRVITLLFVLSICSSQAFADANQERRVTISAAIFPRIVAVDQDLDKKLDQDGNVRLGLLYLTEKNKAEDITKLMTRKISNIAGKKIVFELIKVDEIGSSQFKELSGIFLVQPLAKTELNEILDYSIQHQILIFSPFEGDIERGVMASIFVGAKIRPYFNLTTIKKAQVSLKPALLKVSKIYE